MISSGVDVEVLPVGVLSATSGTVTSNGHDVVVVPVEVVSVTVKA